MGKKEFILKMAKGFYGKGKNCIRVAAPRVEKALQKEYTSRRLKKRDARSLNITQINAATRLYDMSYSQFAHGLVMADIALDRKSLADLAKTEPYSFRAITKHVNDVLNLENQRKQEAGIRRKQMNQRQTVEHHMDMEIDDEDEEEEEEDHHHSHRHHVKSLMNDE